MAVISLLIRCARKFPVSEAPIDGEGEDAEDAPRAARGAAAVLASKQL